MIWKWLSRFRRQEKTPDWRHKLTVDDLRNLMIPRGTEAVWIERPHPLTQGATRWEEIDDVQPDLEDGKVVLVVQGKTIKVDPNTPVRFT